MSKKSRKKSRGTPARWARWDYGWNAAYFVTMVTHNRVRFFGEVVKEEDDDSVIVKFTPLGEIANDNWLEIPKRFSFTRLGEHVVMPDHLHGIVIIDKRAENNPHGGAPGSVASAGNTGGMDRGGVTGEKNPMLWENLSLVMRWYKGRTTFDCRKIQPAFQWQSRFHDHVIRDEIQYEWISNYIRNNPRKWWDKKGDQPGRGRD